MGSGFRTFTAGEVLTASNVQNYLMDQSVMVFGGSAARSSAIGTANFEEGMVSYLTDTDKVEAYNGTNWVSVAPTTSQGLTLINTTSFSGVSSQSINDVFSSTYTNYQIVFNYVGTSNGSLLLRMRVGGADATASNYARQFTLTTSTTFTGGRASSQSHYAITDTGGSRQTIITNVFNPNEAVVTTFRSFGGFAFDSNSALYIMDTIGNHQLSTAYTGFTALVDAGTMTGNIQVYGLNK